MNKSKIVINGKFLSQRVTGVQRYAREIVNELDKLCDGLDVEIALPKNAEQPNYKNIKSVFVGKRTGTLWELTDFARYAKKQKAVSLNLCNSGPLTGRKIVTVHDVKVKAHPEFYSKKFKAWYNILFKNYAKKALKILTVSEFSKSEILSYFKVSADKIEVIYNSWQHVGRVDYDENALNKYSLVENEYYFAMSSLEPNKNFKWIAEAAERNGNDIYAVAGSINEKVFKDGLGFECPKNMRLLGYVSDEEAKTLMRDCKSFLFPSLYEGFGIPPLEAMASGAKNIVVSDLPVMHEIFGDSVDYIGQNEINNRVNKASNILDKFSWEASAQKLFEIISVIN